jgi:hypothetical protein
MNEWMIWCAAALAVAGAVVVWIAREAGVRARSEKMETYLRLEKEAGTDRGQRSVKHLMLKLGMSEGQVVAAAKRSPAIKRLALTANFPGAIFADSAMFEYAPFGSQGRNAA